jgi:cell wall-associated NlpC family hydrolase
MHWTARYVGVPFVDGGREIDGCDCWGLFRIVYAERLGIHLPVYGDTSAHDLAGVSEAMSAGVAANEVWREVIAPQEYDGVLMRAHGKRYPSHVGVIVGGDRVLHVEPRTESVLVPLDHHSVRSRILSYWRHRECKN